MNSLKKLSLCILGGMFLLLASCQDDEMNFSKTTVRPPLEIPGNYADHPGGMPVPTITEYTFIPTNSWFAHTKCTAWRIEWPAYGAGMNKDYIPNFFATSTGALNSSNFLTNNPAVKQNVNFSLYHDKKLTTAAWISGMPASIQPVWMKKYNLTPAEIESIVKNRPSSFESHWPHAGDLVSSEDYKAGDFFLYKLANDLLYGGVRIVSEEPRIIEVYLAMPND